MSPCATGQRLSELNTNVWPLCFSRIIKEMSASHSQQYSNAFRNRQSLRRVRCWLFARDVFFFLFPSVPFFAAIIYTFLLRAATYHERKWPCWVWLPLCSLTKLLITTCADRWWWGFTLLEKVSTIVELFRIISKLGLPLFLFQVLFMFALVVWTWHHHFCQQSGDEDARLVMRVHDWWWYDTWTNMTGQMWNDGPLSFNSFIVSGLIGLLKKVLLSGVIPTMEVMPSFGPYRFPKKANSHNSQNLKWLRFLRSHWQ